MKMYSSNENIILITYNNIFKFCSAYQLTYYRFNSMEMHLMYFSISFTSILIFYGHDIISCKFPKRNFLNLVFSQIYLLNYYFKFINRNI